MSIDHFAPVFVSRERRADAEQPLREDPEPYPQQEDLRQAADSAPDDTDPSEEGMEFLFAPVLAGEPVISGVTGSHVMAWGRHQWA
ncbi:hypothetical protein U9M48_018145 [Paspalum notatum var. saurae]|uniref:Uncharacterized protein n=1 Tax=Paspalum notatum var. saurae TaxID=547442 RepID=A0AAQ3TA24_PASNO